MPIHTNVSKGGGGGGEGGIGTLLLNGTTPISGAIVTLWVGGGIEGSGGGEELALNLTGSLWPSSYESLDSSGIVRVKAVSAGALNATASHLWISAQDGSGGTGKGGDAFITAGNGTYKGTPRLGYTGETGPVVNASFYANKALFGQGLAIGGTVDESDRGWWYGVDYSTGDVEHITHAPTSSVIEHVGVDESEASLPLKRQAAKWRFDDVTRTVWEAAPDIGFQIARRLRVGSDTHHQWTETFAVTTTQPIGSVGAFFTFTPETSSTSLITVEAVGRTSGSPLVAIVRGLFDKEYDGTVIQDGATADVTPDGLTAGAATLTINGGSIELRVGRAGGTAEVLWVVTVSVTAVHGDAAAS